jgi:RHS repeat-associated protein
MNRLLKVISIITLLVFLRTNFAVCAEQVYFYHTDPAGTPLAMSDSTGNVVWRANYLPFGEEMIDLSTVQNNKMFVGKEKDSESGLYYFGARYMDAGAGRFTSPDSVGVINPRTGKINQIILHDSQRLNRYAYGLNNPYRYIDPNGKIAIADDLLFWGLVGLTIWVFSARTAVLLNKQHQEEAGQSSGQSSDTDKGSRTEPRDLEEQLTLEEAKAGAGEPYKGKLGDPKYDPETGTEDKRTHHHEHGDGTSTEVHWDVNRETGESSNYKIKDDTNATSRGNLPQE